MAANLCNAVRLCRPWTLIALIALGTWIPFIPLGPGLLGCVLGLIAFSALAALHPSRPDLAAFLRAPSPSVGFLETHGPSMGGRWEAVKELKKPLYHSGSSQQILRKCLYIGPLVVSKTSDDL